MLRHQYRFQHRRCESKKTVREVVVVANSYLHSGRTQFVNLQFSECTEKVSQCTRALWKLKSVHPFTCNSRNTAAGKVTSMRFYLAKSNVQAYGRNAKERSMLSSTAVYAHHFIVPQIHWFVATADQIFINGVSITCTSGLV